MRTSHRCTLSLHDALPIFLAAVCSIASPQLLAFADPPLPQLTLPVNDFAKVIDGDSAAKLTQMIRSLQQASDRKSTRLNSSHMSISYAVFCLKKKNRNKSL